MACVHLTQLYQLCKENQLHLSSTDLIRVVCKQCQQEEVCPSVLYEELDYEPDAESDSSDASDPPLPPQSTGK